MHKEINVAKSLKLAQQQSMSYQTASTCGATVEPELQDESSEPDKSLLSAASVKESVGDVSCIKGSYAVAARARKSVSETIAKDIRTSWIAPTAATLHWDGKQIATLTDTSKREERQPVLVGNSESTKLLGVARYKPGTDETKPPKLIQQSI